MSAEKQLIIFVKLLLFLYSEYYSVPRETFSLFNSEIFTNINYNIPKNTKFGS